MIEHDMPQERDLPPHRFIQLKDELMAHIEEDLHPQPQPEPQPPATPAATSRRPWRRLGLAAAAVAVVGIAAATMVGGNQPASANTAQRRADGSIVITLREGKNPKDLERRLNDLGVPAVVDFLESGFGCDDARSAGWLADQPGEELFHWDESADDDLILHPDQLHPGETLVLTFQIDEHGDDLAAVVHAAVSTAPVGPCVPVPDASIVDAERGIAGG